MADFPKTMSKTALIIASDGSEDIELTVVSDVLRRANVEVTIASLQNKPTIELARKLKINVDKLLNEVKDTEFDAVILPGGQPGSDNLAADATVGEVLRRHEAAGKIVAAICAAPIAFKAHGIAKGGVLTSYPSFGDRLKEGGYQYSEDRVVVYKSVVTSRGPGTAFDFALKIVQLLAGDEVAQKVRSAMLLTPNWRNLAELDQVNAGAKQLELVAAQIPGPSNDLEKPGQGVDGPL
ncbi:unnamed protein product [Bursaphelenchus xylophilus]|uniref:D-lactate dehydratase n=2 Tax=Bursaphelenchus xylophilus TaxID=6326 RepID=A0A7I8WYA2_BURXY|nr:unnamed protein product [Bursaphelenchus xylophilus]CAG9101290.1 unnamed protein product [Bursaphelenchus xylophilus]